MTNPNLAAILRRIYALVAASVLPAGALILSAGRPSVAFGLAFGAVIGVLNTVMLARRIDRAVSGGVAHAQRVMQQGMGIRFALITLAAVVAVKADPASIVGFLLGLGLAMALAMAVAARALLRTGPLSGFALSPPIAKRLGESQHRMVGAPSGTVLCGAGPRKLPGSHPRSSPPELGERSGERALPADLMRSLPL